MNLEQLPYQPGDIIRERKSNTDYVVESIAGISLTTGIAIVGIGLFNDKVNTWKATSEADMRDQHALILKGTKNLSAAEIRQQFREAASELLKQESDVLNELSKESNLGLRDLLLYGISSKLDDETKSINVAILNLAEALTTMTKAVPDEKIILKILKEQKPSGLSDEALELFARNLSNYSQARASSATFFASESITRDLLLRADGTLGGDLFTLLRGYNRRYTQDQSILWNTNKRILNSIILGDGAVDPGRIIDKTIFGQVVDSPRDRIQMMAEKMFLSRSGRSELSSTTKSFVQQPDLINTVVKVLKGSAVSDKNPNKAGAELLIDALANWLIDPENTTTRKHITKLAQGITLQHSSAYQAEQLAKIRRERHLSFVQRANSDYAVLNRDQYSRGTGIRRPDRLVSYRLMTASEIDNAVSQATNSKFAISKDALYTSVLGNTRLKIENVEGTLKDQTIRRKLSEIDSNIDPYYVITANQIRNMKLHIASSDLGSPLDLTTFLKEQSLHLERINETDRNLLSHIMVDMSKRTGNKSLVGLSEEEKVQEVYYYSSSKAHGLTSDLSYVENLNKKGDLVSFEVHNVAGNQEASSLYKNLSKVERSFGIGSVNSSNSSNKRVYDLLSSFNSLADSRALGFQSASGQDRISELISIVKGKNHYDKIKLLHLNKNSHEEIAKAYEEGYKVGKLALVNIEKPGNTNIGQLTAIASEIKTDLESQLSKAKDYFSGKGIILDIESYNDPRTGLSKITEIAFGDQDKLIHAVGKRDFISADVQAKSIINLTTKLEEQFKSGKSVVGTAGPHDFNTLIQTTSDLIQEITDNTQLHSSTKYSLLNKLTRSLEILKDTQENKLFDVQTLYAFAGYKGIARQSFFTQTLLNRTQKHEAVADVVDLNEILTKLKPQILDNLKSAKFETPEAILKKGVYFTSNDTLDPHGPGHIKRMLGTVDYIDKTTGKVKTYLQYSLYESQKQEDGTFKLNPMNVVGQDEYQSLQQLSLSLQRDHHLFTAEQFNAVLEDSSLGESIAQQHNRLKTESVGRRIRSYNPAVISRWDPLGEWENSYGDYAAFKMHMDKRITVLFPKVQEKYEKEIAKLSKSGEPNSHQLVKAMEHTESWIDQLLNKEFPETDIKPLAKEYFKLGIHDILTGRGGITPSDILDTDSEWNKLLNSEVGNKLLESAKIAIGLGEGPFGQAPDPTAFSVRSYFYTAAAANKAKAELKTAQKVSDFVTETMPRFNLRMGDKYSSAFLMSNNGSYEAQELLKHMGDVAAKVMLAEDRDNKHLKSVLENSKIDFETFHNLMEEAKRTVGDTEQNLETWKNFIRTLGFQGDDTEFKELKAIRKDLIADNLHASVLDTMTEKVNSLKEFMSIEKETTAKLSLKRKFEFANKMLQDLKNIEPSSSAETTAEMISQVFAKHETNSKETFQSVLRDRYLSPANPATLEANEVASIEKSIFGRHGENADHEGILNYLRQAISADVDAVSEQEVMADVAHHVQNVSRKSFGTYEYAVAGKERLTMIARLHKQGNSLATILAGSLDSARKAKLMQHQAVTEVAGQVAKNTTGSTVKQQHNLVTEFGSNIMSASKTYSKVSVPLLALGGLVGFLAAKEPNTGEAFHQGYSSDNLGSSFTGNENAVAKFSEIPGNPDNQQIWYGSTSPFQLDITFKGFVSNRLQHDQLRREVYNILNSNMEIKKNSGEIQDNRNRQHRMAAIEALKGYV